MDDTQVLGNKKHLIYDVLYGFVQITPVEWDIIHTPFYQRLKWIKQLGFSFYSYPGAEHSRFGHSIGVMFNAHNILKSIGKASSDRDLFFGNLYKEDVLFHQMIRLAALLHDIGTFPFSHTIENAYINYGRNLKTPQSQNHEHLGAFIIRTTDFDGGITNVLKRYDIDPNRISALIEGSDESILANQILHSEVDCDRMDYLLRDAHYTGLNYGTYDRDYLLHHFKVSEVSGKEILVIKEKALNCVQDFLLSRFAWYSQVVRSGRGAKFDAVGEQVANYLIQFGHLPTYEDLLTDISSGGHRFYEFNDHYFISLVHSLLNSKKIKDKRVNSMINSIVYGISPKEVLLDEFKQRILDQNNQTENEKIFRRARDKYQEISAYLEKNGKSDFWAIKDLPKKDIFLTKSRKNIIKTKTSENVLLERDPCKILLDSGNVSLIGDLDNNLVGQLHRIFNYIPHVFCSQETYQFLKESNLTS